MNEELGALTGRFSHTFHFYVIPLVIRISCVVMDSYLYCGASNLRSVPKHRNNEIFGKLNFNFLGLIYWSGNNILAC